MDISGQPISRREFVKWAGLLAAGTAALPTLGSCFGPAKTSSPTTSITQTQGIIYSPDTLRANRIPPGQNAITAWPQVQYGATPTVGLDDWTFTISGEVENAVTLNYNEFAGIQPKKVFSDIHCVTHWTRLDNLWDGFGSQTIANLGKLKTTAKYAIIKAENGFTSNVPIDEFLQDDVLFAIRHDDSPLTPEHGWPVRLVVPRLYFWKSAKWVTGIEFSAVDKPGFWETRGYNNHGDPWKQERFS
jgi:DMSO/TMAO reductase YedYZ molybdopterin-dependent catalytic subunit